MDPFCYLVLCLSVLLNRLFLAALWLPAGKGLSSWLSCFLGFLTLCHMMSWVKCGIELY